MPTYYHAPPFGVARQGRLPKKGCCNINALKAKLWSSTRGVQTRRGICILYRAQIWLTRAIVIANNQSDLKAVTHVAMAQFDTKIKDLGPPSIRMVPDYETQPKLDCKIHSAPQYECKSNLH